MKLTGSDDRESGAVGPIAALLPDEAVEVVERGVWHRPAVTVVDLTRTMVAPGGYLDDVGFPLA